MAAVIFDTLKFVEKLTSVGIPEIHAKAQLEALSEVMNTNIQSFITEHELKEMEATLESKIDKLDAKIDKLESRLTAKIDRLDAKTDGVETSLRGELLLIKWMLGFLLTGVTTLIIKSLF